MNLLRLVTGSAARAFSPAVKELGKPTMSLYEPDMETKKATFGMS